MTQPKSIEELHKECYDELAPNLSDGRGGPAVHRMGWPTWLTPELLDHILWWALQGVICRIGWDLARRLLGDSDKKQLEALEKKWTGMDKRLKEVIEASKRDPAVAASQEVAALLRELKPLLQQILDGARSRVTPEQINGANGEALTRLLEAGLQDNQAEEVAETIREKVQRALKGEPSRDTPDGPSPC
jgi:hypothetical protein